MSFNGNLQPVTDEGTDLTTKGDIHGYSTENTRVPIGTDNYVLTADSTNSLGLAWKATAGGADTHTFTTTETWNPTVQTGVQEILIDATSLTTGKIELNIDGSLFATVTSGQVFNRIVNASTSIQLVSDDGGSGNVGSYTYGSLQVPAGNLVSVNFGDSGTKMYLYSNSASDNQSGYQYTLSTAYDITTASYASKSFADPVSDDIRGASWKPDGTRWTRGSDQSGNKALYDFTCTTAWDISTSSSASSYTVSSYQTGVKDSIYGDSGNQVTSLSDNADLNFYELSTAYQVSSATHVSGKKLALSGIDNAPRSHAWNSDGTKFYYLGSQNDKIYTIDCSTAWNPSTGSHNAANDIDVSSETGDPYGITVKDGQVSPDPIVIGSTSSPYKLFSYGSLAYSGTVYASVGQ